MKRQIGRRREFRRFFVFAIFLFALSALSASLVSPSEGAQTLRVSIPGVVQMEGEACALSDIAALEGRRDLTERAGALLLSAQNGVITREQVIDALKVSGLEDLRIELKMPATVRVEFAAQEDSPNQKLPSDQELSFGQELPSENPTVQAESQGLAERIKSLSAWEGEVEAQYRGSVPEGRLVSPASIVPGTSAATLRFRDAAGKERSLAVRLAWSQPALMLTRSVKKGEVLKEFDFVLRQIRVNRAGVYASKASQVVGRSLKKNLSQGEAVVLSLVADVPAVERGKNVTIVVRSAGLTVQAKGEALESGALGDVIKVRNVASKAIVTAVVVAGDTVEVAVPR
ncbi:MAG: flagellar basal body P-ring formation chaperone FlgA [Synergistaceae bacterium]|jgi:flagella basal body P-ring formation protein FlgA|nr:flagellar basal body P-ring formation chaperone FlgA [Synergistaceae bacterium]